ncbi:energy transducer TonB [Novosphingobium sp.]|uniref:energy transducer TonB family protein n=1 Tax=Novosphingobium sp. TaxID=1874826 RepID=UPI0026109F42|nr:energy transducer TonB [Novosphingobium sp.]
MLARILIPAAAILLALVPSCTALAQGLPSVPRVLLGQSGVVCVRLTGNRVADAFVVVSTGKSAVDTALVEWVREMDWSDPESAAAPRDRWFPMPVAFGDGEPPAPPAQCGTTPSGWS